jgi:hypothetical protein
LTEKEGAFWNYDKNGINNPFFGKKHKEETKKDISNKIKMTNAKNKSTKE